MSGLDREEDVIRIIGEAGESAAELANRIKTGQWAYCPEENCIVARTSESAFVRFANEAKLQEYLEGKVDTVEGKGLSTNDYTTVEKNKLAGIQAGAQVNTVTSVASKTGAVTLVKGDVGLGNVDNTSDANKPVSTAQATAIANASTEDRKRSNHTGTQLASTISDLQEAITNNTSVKANTAKVTNQTHTGDVTGSTALTIANNAVNNAKLADMASNTIKGRINSTGGDPQDLTPEQVRTMLNVEDGAQANTVTSVAGKTGAVTLVKGDVGLGNVDNTSDINKPVSTAQANAIANASAEDRKRSNHTGTQAISTVDGLQGVLDGKAPLSHVEDEAEHTGDIPSANFNEWWDNNSFPMRSGRLMFSSNFGGRLPTRFGILQYFGAGVSSGSSTRGLAIATSNGEVDVQWIAHWNNYTNSWSPWQVIANGIVESSATLPGVLSVGDTIEQGLRKAQTQINGKVDNDQLNLIEIDEGNGVGFALKGYDPTRKGNIGFRAVDLSFSSSASETRGSTGIYSHAEGLDTTASGHRSHAEGEGTTASGHRSHAEGFNTTAGGGNSHAEGLDTTASGSGSHAEGEGTTASGRRSHAEGFNTTAGGSSSHAEGRDNEILVTAPEGAHVEGRFCNPVGSDKQSVIGIGFNADNRRDGRIMWTDGTMSLPESTPTLISARGAKSVATVESVPSAPIGSSATLPGVLSVGDTIEQGLRKAQTQINGKAPLSHVEDEAVHTGGIPSASFNEWWDNNSFPMRSGRLMFSSNLGGRLPTRFGILQYFGAGVSSGSSTRGLAIATSNGEVDVQWIAHWNNGTKAWSPWQVIANGIVESSATLSGVLSVGDTIEQGLRKAQTQINNRVSLTGDESISGEKTFSDPLTINRNTLGQNNGDSKTISEYKAYSGNQNYIVQTWRRFRDGNDWTSTEFVLTPRIDNTNFSGLGWSNDRWFCRSNATESTHIVNRRSVKNADIGALTTASGAIQASDSINTAVSKVYNSGTRIYTLNQNTTFNYGDLLAVGESLRIYGGTVDSSTGRLVFTGNSTGVSTTFSGTNVAGNNAQEAICNYIPNTSGYAIAITSSVPNPIDITVMRVDSTNYTVSGRVLRTGQTWTLMTYDFRLVTSTPTIVTNWFENKVLYCKKL